jgi:hypothetical protein
MNDSGCSKSRGTADLPIDVGCLCASGEENLPTGRHVEAACDLKDVNGGRVASGVKSEVSRRNCQGGRGLVKTRRERLPADISGHEDWRDRSSLGVKIGGEQIGLRLLGDRIVDLLRSGHHPGWKSGHGSARPQRDTAINNSEGGGVGNRGGGHHNKIAGRFQVHRCFNGHRGRRKEPHQQDAPKELER